MKILGFDYQVLPSHDSQFLGRCESDKLQIHIDVDIPLQRKLETMIHEIIEAINKHMELGLEHNQITSIAVALHQVISESGVNLKPLLRELK